MYSVHRPALRTLRWSTVKQIHLVYVYRRGIGHSSVAEIQPLKNEILSLETQYRYWSLETQYQRNLSLETNFGTQ